MPDERSGEELKEAAVQYAPAPDFEKLGEALYKEEVLEARAMDPMQKLLLGQTLFEYACEVTLWGIKNQNPGLSEEECLDILRSRLELKRRMDNQV